MSISHYRGAYQRTVVTPECRIVVSTIDVGLQSLAASDRHLSIWADTVLVDGPCQFPGKNIHIVCRQLINAGGHTIDLSGQDAKDTWPADSKALDGKAKGEKGEDGRAGGDGQSAGSFALVADSVVGELRVRAKGGDGGRGQNGGDGIEGAEGQPGINFGQIGERRGSQGGTGLKGGTAGSAGKSGIGGDAGSASIFTSIPLSTPPVLERPAGRGGAKANVGKPGKGGPGGPGTPDCHLVYFGRGVDRFSELQCSDNNDGPTGLQGDEAPFQGNIGKVGAEGSETIVDGDLEIPNWSQYASYPTMLLRMAENTILRNEGALGVERLKWVLTVTKEPTVSPIAGPVHLRAKILLARLRAGLDLYGNPPNYVPGVNFGEYRTRVPELIASGRRLEEDYDKAVRSASDNQAILSALRDELDVAHAKQAGEDREQSKLVETLKALVGEINDLRIQIEAAQLAMLAAEQDFKDEVARSAGCDFLAVVTAVASIVAIAYGAWPAVEALAADAAAALEAFEAVELGAIVSTVEAVTADIETIRTAFSNIQTLIDSGKVTSPDTAKMVQSKKDFDETVAPYLDMAEARVFRDAVYLFLDLTQTRNNKLLEHTSGVLRRAELIELSKLNALQIARVTGMGVDTQDLELSYAVEYLAGAYEQARVSLARVVHDEQRAFNYWALEDHRESAISAMSISEIEVAHTRISTDAIDAMNDDEGVRVFTEAWTYFDLSTLVDPASLEAFSQDWTSSDPASISFTLRPELLDELGMFARVRLVDITVDLPGVQAPAPRVVWSMEHQGLSTFHLDGGEAILFSHLRRQTGGAYDIASGEQVESRLDGDEFIACSPFATWKLKLEASRGHRGVDLRNANCRIGIKVSYEGVLDAVEGDLKTGT